MDYDNYYTIYELTLSNTIVEQFCLGEPQIQELYVSLRDFFLFSLYSFDKWISLN